MATLIQEIGTVPINRGVYNSKSRYYKDNIVLLNNCSYYCTVAGPIKGISPDTDTRWALFSGNPTYSAIEENDKLRELAILNAIADCKAATEEAKNLDTISGIDELLAEILGEDTIVEMLDNIIG